VLSQPSTRRVSVWRSAGSAARFQRNFVATQSARSACKAWQDRGHVPQRPRLRIGPTEIIALADGEGPFFSPRAEAFPEATAAQWAEADRYDPGAVDAEGRWRLQFRAYTIRGDKGLTVVDAGDLLVHALQLLHPDLAYTHETDPEAARHSRQRLLGRETATTLHLATPHLTKPFIPA
jgi:hypothetical protein